MRFLKATATGLIIPLLAGCLSPNSALAQSEQVETASSEAPSAGIVRQVIALKDEDGTVVPAVLTMPASGVNPYMPAIVHHHGGPGGHPVNFSGAPRFFAEGAAKAGYTSLSILSRHSRFYYNTPVGDASKDIKAAIDFLDNYSDNGVILTGHSLGAVRATRYLAETDDPRVKALIQFAPTRDMPEWVEGGMGKEAYDAFFQSAQDLVDTGRGKELITLRFVPESPPWPAGIPVSFTHNAETFLDWWGPNSKSVNTTLIGEIKRPILLLAGDKDGFVYPEYPDELKAKATNSPRVDTISYPGVGHIFVENRPQVIADSLQWLEQIGLGPRPQISIDLVDAQSEQGRKLSGVVYTPAGGEDKSKPAFLLLHGWSGDVLWSSNHWLGVRLAQAGHTAIAMRLRVSGRRGLNSQPLESVVEDIGMWADYLEQRGYSKIVGEGHSAGGIWWTTYLNASKDPRVKGIVYLAQTRNMADSIYTSLGEENYNTLIAAANEAVADGRSREMMISSSLLPEDVRSRFPYFQYPDVFLSYWGPDAKSVHTDEVQKVDIPILAIAGSADGLMYDDYLRVFTRAAGDNAEFLEYEGGPHSLVGFEDRTAADIVDWTEKVVE